MPDEYNGNPLPDEHKPDPGKEGQDENIPEWMKKAGWGTSSGAFDESKPVFDDLDDEDDIVPADIPAWLEEAAPEGFKFDIDPIPDEEKEQAVNGAGAFPENGASFEDGQDEAQTFERDLAPAVEKEAAEAPIDIPSWLENLELDEDSQETAIAWLENMPESLRATEEELQAAGQRPEALVEPGDDLAWMDEVVEDTIPSAFREEDSEAALSEDLVASDLIPEATEPSQLFGEDEIESVQSDVPAWLKELGTDETSGEMSAEAPDFQEEPAQQGTSGEKSMLPDWLADLDDKERESPAAADSPAPAAPTPAEDQSGIPSWLGDFQEEETAAEDESETSLEWLDSLAGEEVSPGAKNEISSLGELESTPDIDFPPEPAPSADWLEEDAEPAPAGESVTANDDTLNTQIPDWLSRIGETDEEELDAGSPALSFEELAEESPADPEEPTGSEFEDSASWLDQIGETSLDEGVQEEEADLLDWLDSQEPIRAEDSALDDLRSRLDEQPAPPREAPTLETAKYFLEEEQQEDPGPEPQAAGGAEERDDLPDWLSELRADEESEPQSLESAIRKSDHELSDAEREFLSRSEQLHEENSDWLSKLDQVEDAAPQELDKAEEPEPDGLVAGGMLERLNKAREPEIEIPDSEIPQWLKNLDKEEDPQETAVLWLQHFIDKGEQANLHAEIKRYTDELNPGEAIPKWMEDLKNEEDPQTTAMLWLEKLSGARTGQKSPSAPSPEDDQSDWLTELEQEQAGQSSARPADKVKEFEEASNGWLADLEIDEKLKASEDDLPEWSGKKGEQEEEPSWMKATSPLEGEIYTDELAGERKEPEIPAWLAGYSDGEEPPEGEPSLEKTQPSPPAAEDDYTWLSAEDAPRQAKKPIDLNKAAISQLEGILGISYQVARAIVQHREKHGPFRDINDLKNVPEIVDEQTIEILKPEVFIGAIEEARKTTPAQPPKPKPAPAQKAEKAATKAAEPEAVLEKARSLVADSEIQDAMKGYASLIKKKKMLPQIIEDLKSATLDHPLEIMVFQTLGDAYMQFDKLDEALEAYSKAEDLLS